MVDDAVPIFVPKYLRDRRLYISHLLSIAGHPSQRKMYDTRRRTYHWPPLTNGIYISVAKCERCAKRKNQRRHRLKLKLLPATGPLEFVAMNILVSLPKTTQGNYYVHVITDRYSKFSVAIPTSKMTSSHRANLFLDYWIVSFAIPPYFDG